MVIQGRELHTKDTVLIRSLQAEHGDWRNGQGRFKDMTARTLLLKLERATLQHLAAAVARWPAPLLSILPAISEELPACQNPVHPVNHVGKRPEQ
jgi:hypothetical protein